jgi:hypothetical protein
LNGSGSLVDVKRTMLRTTGNRPASKMRKRNRPPEGPHVFSDHVLSGEGQIEPTPGTAGCPSGPL